MSTGNLPTDAGKGPPSGAFAIGIDIGGTSIKAVAVTPEGILTAAEHAEFDAGRPLHFLETARVVLQKLIATTGGRPAAVGLCAPGLAAADGWSIANLPDRLPGMEGLDWTAALDSGLRVPVLNDALAALTGETWLGAARGSSNVLLLTLGTGLGGAAMVDGRLLRGNSGRAGHVGHISLNPAGKPDICGTPGSLESAVGNDTIRERTGGRFPTTLGLIKAYESGEAAAREFWLTTLRDLAAGIVSLANVLDPEVVVIGGGIATAGESLFGPLREQVRRMEWQVPGHALRIVPATLGDKAGAFGAARHALSLTENP